MIVQALAKEAENMPFFVVKPTDIFNNYDGGIEKRVKVLFQILEAHRPCILFLDDAEKVLADRSNENITRLQQAATRAFSKEMNHLVYQRDEKKIFVIAATKNSEKIDIISFYSSKGNHTDLSSLSIKTIPFSGVTSIVTTTFGKAIQPQTLAAMP